MTAASFPASVDARRAAWAELWKLLLRPRPELLESTEDPSEIETSSHVVIRGGR